MRDQSSALTPVWHDITARDLPISEDDWIREAVRPEAKQRWDAWILMPRFRVCHDFPAWAVVVVAFCDEARGGCADAALTSEPQRAEGFSVCDLSNDAPIVSMGSTSDRSRWRGGR